MVKSFFCQGEIPIFHGEIPIFQGLQLRQRPQAGGASWLGARDAAAQGRQLVGFGEFFSSETMENLGKTIGKWRFYGIWNGILASGFISHMASWKIPDKLEVSS